MQEGQIKIHAEQPICPVCSGSEREELGPVLRGPPARWLSRHYNRPEADFLSPIVSYRCKHCQAIYNDPYFSLEERAKLFQSIHPQHGGGWARFAHWLSGRPPIDSAQVDRAAYEMAVALIGEIDVYGEVNCPFMGLLMDFTQLTDDRKTAFENNVARNSIHTRMPMDGLDHSRRKAFYARRKGARFWKLAQNLDWQISEKLSHTYHYFLPAVRKQLRNLLRQSTSSSSPQALQKPRHTYLIRKQSSIFWGNNCAARGITCHGVAAGLLDTCVVSATELEEQGIQCDLICLFDVLDHMTNPIEYLKKLAKISRLVLVRTHHPSEDSCQHLFGLPKSFPEYLQEHGFAATDVTDTLGAKAAHYFFVSLDPAMLGGVQASNGAKP